MTFENNPPGQDTIGINDTKEQNRKKREQEELQQIQEENQAEQARTRQAQHKQQASKNAQGQQDIEPSYEISNQIMNGLNNFIANRPDWANNHNAALAGNSGPIAPKIALAGLIIYGLFIFTIGILLPLGPIGFGLVAILAAGAAIAGGLAAAGIGLKMGLKALVALGKSAFGIKGDAEAPSYIIRNQQLLVDNTFGRVEIYKDEAGEEKEKIVSILDDLKTEVKKYCHTKDYQEAMSCIRTVEAIARDLSNYPYKVEAIKSKLAEARNLTCKVEEIIANNQMLNNEIKKVHDEIYSLVAKRAFPTEVEPLKEAIGTLKRDLGKGKETHDSWFPNEITSARAWTMVSELTAKINEINTKLAQLKPVKQPVPASTNTANTSLKGGNSMTDILAQSQNDAARNSKPISPSNSP